MPGIDIGPMYICACRVRTNLVKNVQNTNAKNTFAVKSPFFGMSDFAFAFA